MQSDLSDDQSGRRVSIHLGGRLSFLQGTARQGVLCARGEEFGKVASGFTNSLGRDSHEKTSLV